MLQVMPKLMVLPGFSPWLPAVLVARALDPNCKSLLNSLWYRLTLLFDFSLVVAFESDNRPRLSKKS